MAFQFEISTFFLYLFFVSFFLLCINVNSMLHLARACMCLYVAINKCFVLNRQHIKKKIENYLKPTYLFCDACVVIVFNK